MHANAPELGNGYGDIPIDCGKPASATAPSALRRIVMAIIFKITPETDWRAAEAAGVFEGAPIDLKDGFIHFSDAGQVEETAARHFAGQAGLLLVAFDADRLGDALRWEVSRGGALFPHLYAALDPKAALWAKPLPLGPDGRHVFPPLAP